MTACEQASGAPIYTGDASIMTYAWDDSVTYVDSQHATSRWVIKQPVINGEVSDTPFVFDIQYLGGDPFVVIVNGCSMPFSTKSVGADSTEYNIAMPTFCAFGSFTVRNTNHSVTVSDVFPKLRIEFRNDENTWSVGGFAEPY